MGDTESCGSRASEAYADSSGNLKDRQKVEVYHYVLRKLRDSGNKEASRPGFEDDLWTHFSRLTPRYAVDVKKVDRAEDVLMHKRLLDIATTGPAIEVRLVQSKHTSGISYLQANKAPELNYSDMTSSSTRIKVEVQNAGRNYLPPAFCSSQSLDLSVTKNKLNGQIGEGNASSHSSWNLHEITISSLDKPKFLSQFTSLLSDSGLNIQEAHAFSTLDGYSLDVFVVNGWDKKPEQLRSLLMNEIRKIEKVSWSKQREGEPTYTHLKALNNGVDDVWEIDPELLKFEDKITSTSHSDMYKATFLTQDVAIKIVKAAYLNDDVMREFSQEVYILRRVRHKNIIQFIGACTRPPNLFIVTEFMPGGSVYDFIHKKKSVFKFPGLLKVAIGVSNGMSYLHQNNIIHRDLKSGNLLLDENEVVKVSDFGVARVQTESGVMTAETGTYRWMAPEVIEHKPYNRKADVFSFGIVLWELLTGKLPYERLTPLQAAVGVVKKGLRPIIPKHVKPELVELLERCWQQDPSLRPEFSEITKILQNISNEVKEEDERASKRRNQF
ncbi:serine/threonine-protein kinase STY46-like [Impatiens glandulifera]|uniref:serine/threonine-protein kinase STY46-like n=1 Tax=Impatiens glandulifera TaxID=253017 RepID=UPI001FB0DFC3|nr:serine/threonine-protein kinase STY46-like [Impatiens glandulifera]